MCCVSIGSSGVTPLRRDRPPQARRNGGRDQVRSSKSSGRGRQPPSCATFILEQAALLDKHNNPGPVQLPVGVSVFPNDMPVATHAGLPL